MTLLMIILLAIIQGLAELLPVSSSAHVIVAEKLMGIDPSTPQATLLLVMLHTGTMFAVIVYYWRRWHKAFFSTAAQFKKFARNVIVATAMTGILGFVLKVGIEHMLKHRHPGLDKAVIEDLFKHLELLATGLAAAGAMILFSGLRRQRPNPRNEITLRDSIDIGAVQGLCLPFRGFSRSGATISEGLMLNLTRASAEEFSFALAVLLTPVVIFWEGRRLIQHHAQTTGLPVGLHDFLPALLGMCFSFVAGLVALKLLSRLLERGQWWVFGVYCLVAAGAVFVLFHRGY
jgi:undecaprenyl-diphosphatase